MFFGDHTPITINGNLYKVFHSRPAAVSSKKDQTKRLEKQIESMTKHIKWELSSGYEDENSAAGLATPVFHEGHTGWETAEKRSTSFISFETLQPLVREDLTDCEK